MKILEIRQKESLEKSHYRVADCCVNCVSIENPGCNYLRCCTHGSVTISSEYVCDGYKRIK